MKLISQDPGRYWNPYFGGALLGIVLFLSFFLSGSGLGGSGGLARVVAAATDVINPHYVDTNPIITGMAGGDHNPLDNRFVWMTLGVLIGGFASGFLNRRAKFETRKGPRVSVKTRWAMALLGGVLSGFAARLARGCTSGQALSGGAVLSYGSWGFMLAVFAAGYLFAIPVRRLWT